MPANRSTPTTGGQKKTGTNGTTGQQKQNTSATSDREQQIPVGGDRVQSPPAQSERNTGKVSRDPFSYSSAGEGAVSPFTFMRRFSEEMDRLFEDFGYGRGFTATLSPSVGSTFGRTGRSQGNTSQRLGSGAGSGTQVSRRGGMQDFMQQSTWYPEVEILQRGENLVVRADLPGIKREDVHIDLDDGVLTIRGARQNESTEEREGFFHSERSYGSFARVIPLPSGVEGEQCKAKFDNGVLEVTIPLPEEKSRARRIEIE
jgi:HSP20 family protein